MENQNNFFSKEERSRLLSIFEDYRNKRKRALFAHGLDYENYRQNLRRIKEETILHSKDLREKVIRSLKENGINVFWAEDAQKARDIVSKILSDKKRIVKSKSNCFNEINQTGFLSDKKITETDIGDFITGLVEKEGIHPVLPSLHITSEDIVKAIEKKFDQKILHDKKHIVDFISTFLKTKIIEADAAITGANVITADGHIVVLENEGNISLISRLPKTHIIISGFEKIVNDLSEAMDLVRASSIWGTGQYFPSYVSIISGPSKTADIENEIILGAQGAEEVNLILIDNGRTQLISHGLSELLYCLNCGACLNFCPVFHQIGTAYGHRYLGSRGVIFSAFSDSPERAKKANCFSCTLCSACYENCPVKIDLPRLMEKTRYYLTEKRIQTDANKEMIEKIRKYGNPFGEVEKGGTPDQLYCC